MVINYYFAITHSENTVEAPYTRSVPKVMRMILLRSAEGPGKENGGLGRWRGNSCIQFDLP